MDQTPRTRNCTHLNLGGSMGSFCTSTIRMMRCFAPELNATPCWDGVYLPITNHKCTNLCFRQNIVEVPTLSHVRNYIQICKVCLHPPFCVKTSRSKEAWHGSQLHHEDNSLPNNSMITSRSKEAWHGSQLHHEDNSLPNNSMITALFRYRYNSFHLIIFTILQVKLSISDRLFQVQTQYHHLRHWIAVPLSFRCNYINLHTQKNP